MPSNWRGIAVRYGIYYAVIILLIVIIPSILGRLGRLMIAVIGLPALVSISFSLVGNVVRLLGAGRQRFGLAGYVIGGFMNAVFTIYLVVSGITNLLISVYRGSSGVIVPLMGFLLFLVLGLYVRRSRGSWSEHMDYWRFIRFSGFLSLLSTSLILYAFSILFKLVYKPLSYPFMISSIAAGLLSLTSLVNTTLDSEVLDNVVKSSGGVTASFFGIGLLYALLSIPKPPIWNTYILMVFVILASLVIIYTGYRAYTGTASFIERVEEEVYEAHKREVNLVESPELTPLIRAVEEFIKHGNKEELLVYLTYLLSNNGYEFEEIRDRLGRLMDYSSIKVQGARVSRRVIEAEVMERISLVNELLSDVLRGGGSK
ncbi:hypothetical protein [Vulcanisaeta thermophila]|uniref:hypothetical protein n=1 Tax=Vulcanisaeta thermophila TaxID=867917 RepID=UPI00085334D5|nr:hypothetical protein [Vulcanisaeta thermophila]